MDRETDAVEHNLLRCYIIVKSRWTAYMAEMCEIIIKTCFCCVVLL
jgi:hypothetical protein